MKKLLILSLFMLTACGMVEQLNQLELLVTQTPVVTPTESGVFVETEVPPTATTQPTITFTPTPENCVSQVTEIECVATVCSLRYEPLSGSANIAYNVPHGSIFTATAVCRSVDAISGWYYLEGPLYAAQLDTVWKPIGD